ncbi:MAG: glycosyltransferase [Candidatus Limnocylindrales bacterium]
MGRPDPLPTLLFAPESFDLAETTRMLEVARACGPRWNIEFMCYGGRFVHLIEEAGYPCHCLAPDLSPARVEELGRALRMERGGRMFSEAELVQRVHSELRLFEALRPAAVVTGFVLSTYLSARRAGVPLVTVAPLAVTRPFFEAGLGTFPDHFDRGPLRLVPQRLKDSATNWWGLHTRQWLRPFNAAARDFRLPPFRRLVDLVEADEMLITNIPEIVGLADLPPHWRYVGPIFAHLAGEVPAAVRALPRDQPLVYFSLGSLPNLEILDRLLQALGRLPVRVVAPIATLLQERTLTVPPNVQVFDLLPAHKVCPLFDVALIHGGEGTVQTACAGGVPFVAIGFTPEQDANIGFLVRRGTAIRLRRREADAAHLGRAFEQLLRPEVRQRAAELQELVAAWDGPANVARFLERYARPRMPAVEPAATPVTLEPEPRAAIG